MTDWNQKFADASAEVDKYLREAGIEPPVEKDGDTSGTYQRSIRKMLFSEDYSEAAKKMLREAQQCANPTGNPACTKTEDLTLDHTPAVSSYFNSVGWGKSRDERDRWYTDTTHLQVLCRSCNSMKGGEPFDIDKVARCLREGRG